MKKKVVTLGLSLAISLSAAFISFAAQWQQNATGWWYQNDNGSYPTNCWQWIDGNNDGISESYYFNSEGYCLQNTTTPDGYTVNESGAWVINGAIQTQTVATQTQTNTDTQMAQVQAIMPREIDAGGYIVYVPDLDVTEEDSVLYDSIVSYWVETPELTEDFIKGSLDNPQALPELTEEQRLGLVKGVLIKYPH